MSDTSEAPSLASHVRRVRVPSQASDVDQFLDELFSPVLDGNLDELSDARSLAASIKGGGGGKVEAFDEEGFDDFLDNIFDSTLPPTLNLLGSLSVADTIKGGGNRNRTTSQESSLLDKEVENITQENGVGKERSQDGGSSVDDYISDLFQPIFINDSLKNLAEKNNLVDSIKGGGTTHQPAGTSGYNFSNVPAPIMSPPPMLMPLLGAGQEGFMHMYNMQGLNLPPNTDIVAYQQNLQRAFLQSAMAQNIQIQQQLLAQNQALQQMLTSPSTEEMKKTERYVNSSNCL